VIDQPVAQQLRLLDLADTLGAVLADQRDQLSLMATSVARRLTLV